jgi:anti-anti-sigma factor
MLEMNVLQQKSTNDLPVTVLRLDGKLDGSNYESLITKGKELYDSGSRDLLLDMGKLTYISSAGISALHRLALLFQGKKVEDLEEGWRAYRAVEQDSGGAVQEHVKLLNPTEGVMAVLDKVGFLGLFEFYTDIDKALDSFK